MSGQHQVSTCSTCAILLLLRDKRTRRGFSFSWGYFAHWALPFAVSYQPYPSVKKNVFLIFLFLHKTYTTPAVSRVIKVTARKGDELVSLMTSSQCFWCFSLVVSLLTSPCHWNMPLFPLNTDSVSSQITSALYRCYKEQKVSSYLNTMFLVQFVAAAWFRIYNAKMPNCSCILFTILNLNWQGVRSWQHFQA